MQKHLSGKMVNKVSALKSLAVKIFFGKSFLGSLQLRSSNPMPFTPENPELPFNQEVPYFSLNG